MPKYVVMRVAFLLVVLLYSVSNLAQENTFQKKRNVPTDQEVYNEDKETYSRVLIIPFEPKMYISGIDRQIAQRTGLSYHEIRDNMRFAIAEYLRSSVGGGLKVTSLLHIDSAGVAEDLAYIYSSIGYKYKVLPTEDQQKAMQEKEDAKLGNKIKGSFNRLVNKEVTAEEKEEDGASIKNGQIYTVRSNDEKYMNTSIHNPNLLKVLGMRYECDVFLFINELDIEEEAEGERVGLSSLAYKRKVKVHYTIFDKNGKELRGGAAITYLPANVNDMNKIIHNHFPTLAEDMASELPGAQISDADKQMQKEQEKKAEEQRKEIEKL